MRRASRAATACGVALVAVAAWLFWPATLGGRAVYVVTHGVSMQPRFHTGDLAILHTQTHYAVGDIAGYRSVTLHTTVMHRIVARDGDRYVFKGDNNTWLDPDHPDGSQLLGRLWLHVPTVGRWLAAAQSPWVLAGGGLVMTALTAAAGERRRRHRRAAGRRPRMRHGRPQPSRLAAAQTLTLAATVVAAAGAAAAWTAPLTHTVDISRRVTAHGTFTYAGTATPGVTYPDGRISTGDPVFAQLADSIDVAYAEQIAGGRTAPAGSVRLVLSLAAPDGWHTTIASGPAAPLRSGTTTARVPVSIAGLRAALAAHAAEVDASAQQATVAVTAVTRLSGAPSGTNGATLGFTLQPDGLHPLASSAPAEPTPLGSVTVPAAQPTTISMLGHRVALRAVRVLAAALAALGLVAFAALLTARRRDRGDPARAFLRRNRGRVLEVSGLPDIAQLVDIADADALARLAQHNGQLILHCTTDDRHTFLVQCDGLTYRHTVPRYAPVTPLRRVA